MARPCLLPRQRRHATRELAIQSIFAETKAPPSAGASRLDRAGCFLLRWSIFLLGTLWAAGAIYVDGPLGKGPGNAALAVGWTLLAAACLTLIRRPWKRGLAWLLCFLVVLLPWLAEQASNERDWSPDWAETGWADLERDRLTFHNFRNFDYTRDGEVTERWETRTVSLLNLRGMDYFHNAWGGDLLAHPILSFDFGPDGRVALSIETRREKGEVYSKIGGLYKMYELLYMFGEEPDFVRLRTNLRDEPTYLYRTTLSPERALFVLLDSVRTQNQLRLQPRYYNLVTANCTTALLTQTLEFREAPLDLRMLANGKLDELLYEQGMLETAGLPFAELRRRALINEVALAAHDDLAFSERIREGRPGFDLGERGRSSTGEGDSVLAP